MRPYFSVGEEVILCSEYSPEDNGEYKVEDIAWTDGGVNILGKHIPPGFKYKLSPNGFWIWWHESALRKKHKPADQQFQELIKSTREIKV